MAIHIQCNERPIKTVRSEGQKGDEELAHFDLYRKRDAQFVKHLTSHQLDGRQHGFANLSVQLDSPIGSLEPVKWFEEVKDQHVVVMSITGVDNEPRQPNVTLYFNDGANLSPAPPLLIGREQQRVAGQPSAADRFPRTSNSGE